MRYYLALLLMIIRLPTYAGRFPLTIVNEVPDGDDPIRLKSINMTIGTIEDLSCKEGDPIGKKLTMKIKTPSIQHMLPDAYIKSLHEQGKELDNITLSNASRAFTFSFMLACDIILLKQKEENIHAAYLPSAMGFNLHG